MVPAVLLLNEDKAQTRKTVYMIHDLFVDQSGPKGGKGSPAGCSCLPTSSIATSHVVPIPALAQTSMGSAADAPTEHDRFD